MENEKSKCPIIELGSDLREMENVSDACYWFTQGPVDLWVVEPEDLDLGAVAQAGLERLATALEPGRSLVYCLAKEAKIEVIVPGEIIRSPVNGEMVGRAGPRGGFRVWWGGTKECIKEFCTGQRFFVRRSTLPANSEVFLWKIEQKGLDGYEIFRSAIVAAATDFEAKCIHPEKNIPPWDGDSIDVMREWSDNRWVPNPAFVSVTRIGRADSHIAPGTVVHTDFYEG